MDIQDVAFHNSRASFSTIFLKNCVRSRSLGISICLKTVVGVKQGLASSKIPLL